MSRNKNIDKKKTEKRTSETRTTTNIERKTKKVLILRRISITTSPIKQCKGK